MSLLYGIAVNVDFMDRIPARRGFDANTRLCIRLQNIDGVEHVEPPYISVGGKEIFVTFPVHVSEENVIPVVQKNVNHFITFALKQAA